MKLRVGQTLASVVDSTKVVVIRAPARDVALMCGGAALSEEQSGPPGSAGDGELWTQIGKRYVDASGEVELLCTRAGRGELAVDGDVLTVKAAKPLPASD